MVDNGIICQLAELNDRELAELIAKAKEIHEARQRVRKEEDWRKVMDAIHDYTEKYGEICVEDEGGCVWIDKHIDSSEIGQISPQRWRD